MAPREGLGLAAGRLLPSQWDETAVAGTMAARKSLPWSLFLSRETLGNLLFPWESIHFQTGIVSLEVQIHGLQQVPFPFRGTSEGKVVYFQE